MKNNRSFRLWAVNVASFILFALLSITGLVNWLVLPHGPGLRSGESSLITLRHFIRDVHGWLGFFFILVIAIHLVLHWSYIKAGLKKHLGITLSKP